MICAINSWLDLLRLPNTQVYSIFLLTWICPADGDISSKDTVASIAGRLFTHLITVAKIKKLSEMVSFQHFCNEMQHL